MKRLAAALLAAGVLVAMAPSATASPAQDSLVSENVQHGVGWDVGTFGDGSAKQVWGIQSGKTNDAMYGCGKGAMPDGSHKSIIAWTGLANVKESFNPIVNGTVYACLPDKDGWVTIGGGFTKVNGQPQAHLAQVDAETGALNPAFHPKVSGGVVRMAVRSHGTLIIGGNFTQIGSHTQQALGSVDPVTGRYSRYLNDRITGHPHRPGEPIVGPNIYTGTAKGDRLAVVFDAKAVNGHSRRQVAQWILGGDSARLSGWNPPILHNPGCGQDRLVAQDVALNRTARWLYVASTGGPGPGICDALTAFNARTGKVRWINETCNDTLRSVAVTSAAIYTGGHQKCHEKTPGSLRVNNGTHIPTSDPGFAERNGFAAIRPRTGDLILRYRSDEPRCVGTSVLTVARGGLWGGKDCPFGESPFTFRAQS